MANRSIFNRRYTSYDPAGTQVWLINGAGVATTPSSTQNFTAGAALLQGQPVYVSGAYVFPSSAASGTASEQFNVVGITSESAISGSGVAVNVDEVVTINGETITAETALTPGQYYYLSKFSGELVKYDTASGVVTAASGYAALVTLGLALSTSELHVEIDTPVDLYS